MKIYIGNNKDKTVIFYYCGINTFLIFDKFNMRRCKVITPKGESVWFDGVWKNPYEITKVKSVDISATHINLTNYIISQIFNEL